MWHYKYSCPWNQQQQVTTQVTHVWAVRCLRLALRLGALHKFLLCQSRVLPCHCCAICQVRANMYWLIKTKLSTLHSMVMIFRKWFVCTVLRPLNFVLLIFWYTLCPVGECYLTFFSGFRRSCNKFRKIKE